MHMQVNLTDEETAQREKVAAFVDDKLELPSFDNNDFDQLLLNEASNDDQLMIESPALLRLTTPSQPPGAADFNAEAEAVMAD